MARLVRFPLGAAAATVLILAGCATRPVPAPPPVAVAPLPPPPPPVLPAGIPANLAVPAADAEGNYLTINRGLDPATTAWHVRSALNVAALGCRGAGEAEIIAAYNTMLKGQRAPLAAALRATEARFKAEIGRDWQAEHDRHMTRVYNFFAQPIAHDRFCAEAAAVLAEANAVPGEAFVAFAASALPRLEAPFTDVYRAYDGYRRELAAWQARWGNAPATALAAAEPAQPVQLAQPAAPAPRLAYADMAELIRWDARERPVQTALR